MHALVFCTINQYTKFEVPSFTDSKNKCAFPKLKLEEGNIHNSAKTHAGTVFVTRELYL